MVVAGSQTRLYAMLYYIRDYAGCYNFMRQVQVVLDKLNNYRTPPVQNHTSEQNGVNFFGFAKWREIFYVAPREDLGPG